MRATRERWLGRSCRPRVGLPLLHFRYGDGGIVGTHASDLIGEVCLAVEMGCDLVDVGKTIHPHSTLCESVGMAAEVFEGVCTDLPPTRRR